MFKKLLFSVVASFLAITFVSAQTPIPNGSFETWTAGNTPDGWGNSDKVITDLPFSLPDPGGVEKDTAAANVFAGTASIRLTTKTINIIITTQTVPGVVSLGTLGLDLATQSPTFSGLAYTDRPDSLTFAAKYSAAQGSTDTGAVILTLTRYVNGERQVVANSIVRISNPNYQVYTVKINYQSAQAPDTLLIQGLSGLSQNVTQGSTLWLDSLAFAGLDTAFKAYIAPLFNTQGCEGDTLNFYTDNFAGDTYQWFRNGQPINGATTTNLNVTTAGRYSVQVVHGGTTYLSDSVNVTFNQLPTVNFNLSTQTICDNAGTLILSGGTPAGGDYNGNGVDNNEFDPDAAGVGAHDITYIYTDNNGCTVESAPQTITVLLCTGIQAVEGWAVNIYPNPATNFMTVETNTEANGGRIEIYSVEGRLMMTETISSVRQPVNVSALPAGNYSISLSNAQGKNIAKATVSVTR